MIYTQAVVHYLAWQHIIKQVKQRALNRTIKFSRNFDFLVLPCMSLALQTSLSEHTEITFSQLIWHYTSQNIIQFSK